MSLISMILLSLSVSTDAFAASVGKGLRHKGPSLLESVRLALIFAGLEMSFLLTGWLVGSAANQLIKQVDHWVAFIVLSLLGLKMIFHNHKAEGPTLNTSSKIGLKALLLTAIGTSIDSIAVGISVAFIDIPHWLFIGMTGIATFVLTLVGAYVIAQVVGKRAGSYAEKLGGVILIGLGVHILLGHLGIL